MNNMKRINFFAILLLFATALFSVSCELEDDVFAGTSIAELTIEVEFDDSHGVLDFTAEEVSIVNMSSGDSYVVELDANGAGTINLANGRYFVQYSKSIGDVAYNAVVEGVALVGVDLSVKLSPIAAKSSGLVIKEVYCGSCLKLPEEGDYGFDKYVILHNNSSETIYLDGLCYGVADPYNSQASSVWVTRDEVTGARIYEDNIYMIQAIWQFGGNGTDYPLEPGADAVLCNNGAIDHRSQYPLSVNLNKAGYYVLYDIALFDHVLYHPAPGDQISTDRYIPVALKMGVATGWSLSIYSPAVVIFRPDGMSLAEYISDDTVFQKPASSYDKVMKVPNEWVIDGVEVLWGGSTSNTKRLGPVIDAGYVTQSAIYDGKSLMRRVDTAATAAAGYEVLVDTNNSSNDFYERSEASLRDE